MKPKPLASLNHFTVPCSAMLIPVFLSIDLRWRDSEVLKAGWLDGRRLPTTDPVNALIIVRSVRTIGKPSSLRGTHELVGFDFREISDLLALHTFPPGERLALADGRPLNATPRLRSAALPMLVWSAPLLSSCHTETAKASPRATRS